MARLYKPIVVDVTMSQYGYWIVTISTAPSKRMSIMICSVGITRTEAEAAAFTTITGISARKG